MVFQISKWSNLRKGFNINMINNIRGGGQFEVKTATENLNTKIDNKNFIQTGIAAE